MNIVMLGHQAAGKTTYVSLMYYVMRSGVEGFSLRAADSSDDRALTGAAEDILSGRYPPPSNQRAVFELMLLHNGTEVFPFFWKDYRGGALGEKAVSSPQAKQLHEELRTADGIVVFCDAERLVNRGGDARKVRLLVTHVLRALSTRQDVITPLVIAVTKSDLIDLTEDKVIEAITEPFIPLVEAVAQTQHVVGTIIPVACGPAPVNVVIPVLWSLRLGIIGRALQLQHCVQENLATAQDAAARDTLWDRLDVWWNGGRRWIDISKDYNEAAEKEHALLGPLIEPAQRLGDLLTKVHDF